MGILDSLNAILKSIAFYLSILGAKQKSVKELNVHLPSIASR